MNRILLLAAFLSAIFCANANSQILSKSSNQKVKSFRAKRYYEQDDPLDALNKELVPEYEIPEEEEEVEEVVQSKQNPYRKVRQEKDWFRGDEVTVAPMLGVMFLQSPFSTGVTAGCEFMFNTLISPFFVGAAVRGEIGFPRDNFPYEYVMDGNKLSSPDIVAGTLYFPIGLNFDPFHNGITVNTFARLGFKLCSLISTTTVAKSKLHPAFYSAVCLGIAYKGFDLSFAYEYDSVGGFSPELQLAYRFNIGVKKYKNESSKNNSKADKS